MRAFFAFLLAFSLLSLASATAGAAAVYQCPMHPWIKSAEPGKCTICGMDLVATSAAASSNSQPSTSNSAASVTLPPSTVTTLGVQTALVTRQPLSRTIRVPGRIDDDDTRHRILSARVPGRIEKLFVTFVGAPVAADAPLATLWSAEVLTAERVYVERLKGGDLAFSASEQAAAREQLQQLGLAASDLAELERTRTPSPYVTIRAPFAGTVVSKSVYEGQYVQASDRLFEVADFSRMWFVFDAYAQDIPWLRVGQTVEITTRAVPGEVISAPIEFIDPNFDEAKQTSRVRAILPNPHYSVAGEAHFLPHRVLAEGRVLVATPPVLTAPRSAVLDAGTGPVAYVETATGAYEPRSLQLGRRGDAQVEILSGLTEGEHVVTEGNLLIDAQAQLAREANSAGGAGSLGPPKASAEPGAPSSRALPSDAPASAHNAADLATLATAAVASADALAGDDFARYRELFPQLTAAAQAFPSLPALVMGDDLRSARRAFEPWSTAVANLLKPHAATLSLKIFECPMSPVLHAGRWMQHSLPLKNPFFGSAMLECGEEVR